MSDLRERNSGLGASDAPVALGLSEWRTPFELWLEKVGRGQPFEETMPVQVGKALEPVILSAFMQKTGLVVSDAQRQIVDPANPWRWVTLDGRVSDGALLEAKAISWTPDQWGEPGTDQVPMPYVVQAQHGMACTGAVLCYVPVLFEAKRFEIYKVQRDEALIAAITEREREFWRRVIENDPPPIVNTTDARLKYERSAETTVEATPEVREMIATILQQAEALEAAELQHDVMKAQVMEYMGESAILSYNGSTLATWRTAKGKTGLDAEAIRRDHGTKYDKAGAPSRRFLIKQPKRN